MADYLYLEEFRQEGKEEEFGEAADVLEVVFYQASFQFGGVNRPDGSFPMNEELFDAPAGKRFLQAPCQYFDFG